MLNQYIVNLLKENDEKLKQLEEKRKNLQREEESCFHMIQNLVDQEDVGMELFSPRNTMDSTRQKVTDIKKQIEELQLQQQEISEEIDKRKTEENKYQDMLIEIKNRDNEQYQLYQLKQNPPVLDEREEFKNILARVDRSLSLLNTNKSQCKNELMNLKYYLKALLSRK